MLRHERFDFAGGRPSALLWPQQQGVFSDLLIVVEKRITSGPQSRQPVTVVFHCEKPMPDRAVFTPQFFLFVRIYDFVSMKGGVDKSRFSM